MAGMDSRSADPLARIAEQQTWLTADAQQAAQDAVRSSFKVFGESAEAVRSALHGDWLHEPLHAVLTDIPIGAWTGTVLFDSIAAVSGSSALDSAADATALLGLAGAAGAALTGMNDWADVEEAAPRRIGAVHAILNIAATALFAWSAVARRKPARRGQARATAAAGYVLVSLSAHLGGSLVYEHGLGVEERKTSGS